MSVFLNSISIFIGTTIALSAHAEVYLTSEQATQALFPGTKMKRVSIELSEIEINFLKKSTKSEVRGRQIVAWKDKSQNTVYIDQVLGKHELITYAVGIDVTNKIVGVEILEYREAYGKKIHELAWRKQFLGKDKNSPLEVGQDIKNISGATLSSNHVTDGVKRLMLTHELLKKRI